KSAGRSGPRPRLISLPQEEKCVPVIDGDALFVLFDREQKSPGITGAFSLTQRQTSQPMMEKPPSMGIAVPVTKSEAADARKTEIPAKSSIAPQRAAGVRASTRSCRPFTSTRARLVRSVSIQPGRIALAWMLSPAQAQAQARVNCTMPPWLEA